MSDMPPPPPSSEVPPSGQPTGATPPPPPPGSPSGGAAMPQFDFNKASDTVRSAAPLDLALLLAGPVVFVMSLIPLWYRVHVSAKDLGFSGVNVSESDWINAWHNPVPWLGVLLVLAGSVLILLGKMGSLNTPQLPMITVGLFGLATVFLFIGLFVHPGGSYGSIHYSSQIFEWLALIIAAGCTALTGRELMGRR
jgi:hypothetical protein